MQNEQSARTATKAFESGHCAIGKAKASRVKYFDGVQLVRLATGGE